MGAGVRRTDEAFLLLHGSAMTGAMWRLHRGHLETTHACFTPDRFAHGVTPLREELRPETLLPAQVDALITYVGETPRLHVVGHSFGGVVALEFALRVPERVASLCLIEPVVFALLETMGRRDLLDDVSRCEDAAFEALRQDDSATAARLFVDYWHGSGFWDRLPDLYRAPLIRMARVLLEVEVRANRHATLAPEALSRLTMPVLVLAGGQSPAPAREVSRGLAALIPNATFEVFEAAGHHLPSTHARAFIERLRGFVSMI